MLAIQRKLMIIIGMAYEISQRTKADVFIDYSGHVNYMGYQIYKDGWKEYGEPDYKGYVMEITSENLDQLIKLLQEVNKELEV